MLEEATDSLNVSKLLSNVHNIISNSIKSGTDKDIIMDLYRSIDTTVLQTKHHFSYIPHDVAPSLATAALTQIGAAVFAFSYPSADLRLVTLPPLGTDAAVLQVS